jgi:protein phosphatase 1 regulatory subunit 7
MCTDLANNKIKSLSGLRSLSLLRKLDLGANRIRYMDPEQLCGLVSLEELWIGKNKIEKIEGLSNLTKLRRLDIQSNRLTKIENLVTPAPVLEELFLAHNAIDNDGATQATGLSLSFPYLSVLDLGRNRLTSINFVSHIKSLDELWVSGNQISTFDEVQHLHNMPSLNTIYLEYNPIQDLDPLYRKHLAEIIPCLQQIDANLIGSSGTSGAHTSNAMITATKIPPQSTSLTEIDRLRQLQDKIIEQAKAETLSTS